MKHVKVTNYWWYTDKPFKKKICVTDHDSIKIILRATPFLSSVISRSLCSPHQGPDVNRDIKILPPGPMLRCRQCCPSFKQPACFTMLPFRCVTHRCKCNLMIDNNATCSCNVSCVYQPLILTGKTFLVLLELCMASDDRVFSVSGCFVLCLSEFLYCKARSGLTLHLINTNLTSSLNGAHREIIRWWLYVILTTYRDQFRFGFHYLIKRVQQLADSCGCQTGLKVALWHYTKEAGGTLTLETMWCKVS